MQCEEVREQFADYVIESLEEPARSQVAQHLMSCASCQVEAGELKTLWTALGSLPAERPSPELRMRFDVMLEAYKHGLDHAPARTWPPLSHWYVNVPAVDRPGSGVDGGPGSRRCNSVLLSGCWLWAYWLGIEAAPLSLCPVSKPTANSANFALSFRRCGSSSPFRSCNSSPRATGLGA